MPALLSHLLFAAVAGARLPVVDIKALRAAVLRLGRLCPASGWNSGVSGGVLVAMAGLTAAVLITVGALAAPTTAGDSWRALHRTLHLPQVMPGATCPVSKVDRRVAWERIGIFGGSGTGRGPAYPGIGGQHGQVPFPFPAAGGWRRQKVFWYVAPSYRRPVLIRGGRIDAPGQLRFGSGGQVRELRIPVHSEIAWMGQPAGSRGAPSYLRIHASGCYAVQIDGTSFSRIVVFSGTLAF
jgi:hypothetical protein